MELIPLGIGNNLIALSEDGKSITYLHQNKRRNYANPEEQVQAETFLKLVLEYGYPVEHIEQFVTVKMGSSSKEADIIVYKDAAHTLPYIVIECKSQDVSEQEFKKDGVDQAFRESLNKSRIPKLTDGFGFFKFLTPFDLLFQAACRVNPPILGGFTP